MSKEIKKVEKQCAAEVEECPQSSTAAPRLGLVYRIVSGHYARLQDSEALSVQKSTVAPKEPIPDFYSCSAWPNCVAMIAMCCMLHVASYQILALAWTTGLN